MIEIATAKRLIFDRVEHYRQVAIDKGAMRYDEYLPHPDFSLRGTCAGQANDRLLRFNLDIAVNNIEAFLDDIVPHEIAHVIQRRKYPYSKSHSPEWKKYCILLTGRELARCHTFDCQKARIVRRKKYTCGCMGKIFNLSTIKINRINRGAKYVCPQCRIELTPY
jgi:SprT protein